MAAGLIDELIAALARRRAAGVAVAAADAAAAAVAHMRTRGVTRALLASDGWIDALGLSEALVDAGIEVVRWPSDEGWRTLLGLEGAADTCGVTVPVAAVAERGTLVLATDPGHGRAIDVASRHHLALLRASAVHPTLAEALATTYGPGRTPPSAVSLVSGPSRSSDIEKISTLGAHGALSMHVLVVTDA